MSARNIYRLNVVKLSRMRVTSVLGIILIVTNAFADNIEIKKAEEAGNLEVSKFQEFDVIPSTADEGEDNEITRAKKSTTTTFCVEVRPSGSYEKPFQVCETAQPASAQTHQAYYAAPVYMTQDQAKPEQYKAPAQPKPNAVYSLPVKTYAAQPKQYAGHAVSYDAYTSSSAAGDMEERKRRLIHNALAENQATLAAISANQQLRSAGYGSHGYSTPSSYIPVVPSETVGKPHSHNGLVITCQPNLAGYAHNVPSSVHHPPALHTYSYRSATPAIYGDKYGKYQAQSHSYGSYQQPPPYKVIDNAYKTPSVSQQAAGQSTMFTSQASASVYNQPHSYTSTSVPQTHFAAQYQPTQAYSHYSQGYGQTPETAYSTVPASYGPSPVPYASASSGYTAPTTIPTSFSQRQSFSAPSSSASQAQNFVSSPSYREAEEERKLQKVAQQHKEKHTLAKMEEMSKQRAAGSQWGTEMSQGKANKIGDHVESSSSNRLSKKRSSDMADEIIIGVDKVEAKQEAENEVNRGD